MSDLNAVMLSGRVVKDAVIKQKDERQIAFFTIAVNDTRKDSNGNYYSEANFFPVSVLVKTEKFASYLKKGQPLTIEGKLRQITKEVGTDSNGKRLLDSRIYISVRQIHLVFTGRKDEFLQQTGPTPQGEPDDFVVEPDVPNDDLYFPDGTPEMY